MRWNRWDSFDRRVERTLRKLAPGDQRGTLESAARPITATHVLRTYEPASATAVPAVEPFPTIWLTGSQSVAAATLDPFAWDSVYATAGSVAASPPGLPFAWDSSDPTNLYLAGEFWFLATLYAAFASDAAGYRKVDLNGFLDTRPAVNGAPTEWTMAQQWPCETSQTVNVDVYHTGGGALTVTAHLMVTAFPTASPPYEQIHP